jgi:hypothetical protein
MKLIKAVWFSLWFRLFFVLIPTYWIVIIPVLVCRDMLNEDTINLLSLIYIALFFIAAMFNNECEQ